MCTTSISQFPEKCAAWLDPAGTCSKQQKMEFSSLFGKRSKSVSSGVNQCLRTQLCSETPATQ